MPPKKRRARAKKAEDQQSNDQKAVRGPARTKANGTQLRKEVEWVNSQQSFGILAQTGSYYLDAWLPGFTRMTPPPGHLKDFEAARAAGLTEEVFITAKVDGKRFSGVGTVLKGLNTIPGVAKLADPTDPKRVRKAEMDEKGRHLIPHTSHFFDARFPEYHGHPPAVLDLFSKPEVVAHLERLAGLAPYSAVMTGQEEQYAYRQSGMAISRLIAQNFLPPLLAKIQGKDAGLAGEEGEYNDNDDEDDTVVDGSGDGYPDKDDGEEDEDDFQDEPHNWGEPDSGLENNDNEDDAPQDYEAEEEQDALDDQLSYVGHEHAETVGARTLPTPSSSIEPDMSQPLHLDQRSSKDTSKTFHDGSSSSNHVQPFTAAKVANQSSASDNHHQSPIRSSPSTHYNMQALPSISTTPTSKQSALNPFEAYQRSHTRPIGPNLSDMPETAAAIARTALRQPNTFQRNIPPIATERQPNHPPQTYNKIAETSESENETASARGTPRARKRKTDESDTTKTRQVNGWTTVQVLEDHRSATDREDGPPHKVSRSGTASLEEQRIMDFMAHRRPSPFLGDDEDAVFVDNAVT